MHVLQTSIFFNVWLEINLAQESNLKKVTLNPHKRYSYNKRHHFICIKKMYLKYLLINIFIMHIIYKNLWL
jgi:hypothetical protein